MGGDSDSRELAGRIASLSPERRKLLQQLLEKEAGAPAGAAGDAAGGEASDAEAKPEPDATLPQPTDLTAGLASIDTGAKGAAQRFYDQVNSALNAGIFGTSAYFLNFGYVPNEAPSFSRVELPEHYLHKNSVRLVLELVGDAELTDRRVLDVGCGRGGTVRVISQFFEPRSVTGIDISAQAITFCRKSHRYPGVRFFQCDAENIFFEDGSFEVVTNVESSHSYPDIRRFHSEVARVLADGGLFLYTDVLPPAQFESHIENFRRMGFVVEHDRDISLNTLLSCDQSATLQVQAFDGQDEGVMTEFLGAPGSKTYTGLKSGSLVYRMLRLAKRS